MRDGLNTFVFAYFDTKKSFLVHIRRRYWKSIFLSPPPLRT